LTDSGTGWRDNDIANSDPLGGHSRIMRCIFCLRERPGTVEHIFPLAIGGCLTTDRVCKPCNSMLGSRVDAALTDNFLVRTRRALIGIAGNQGTAPPIYEELCGTGELAAHPGRRVHIGYNRATKKMDVRALPHVSPTEAPDGTKGCRIILDERDIGKLPRIIQRERKNRGFPPLTEQELASEVARFATSRMAIENPQVLIKKTYKFHYVSHAMIKIAYELAFLWLGEGYLDDPLAAELRAAICAPDPNSTDRLPAAVMEARECDVLQFWSPDKKSHIAYAFANDDRIAIAVRIFDIYAAVVWVTTRAAQYLSSADAQERLRFLSIDPERREKRYVPMMAEMHRIAKAMVEHGHATVARGEAL
jgi:HNH endonuclease